MLRRFGIKSVLNLRGPAKNPTYRSERRVCRELGVEHADVSLSACRLPKPVLVHCQQGADRSGLVSTLYVNIYDAVPIDRAEAEQLTWRYGHFGFVGTWRMERFFDLYRQTGRGQNLRTWISRTYPAVFLHEAHRI